MLLLDDLFSLTSSFFYSVLLLSFAYFIPHHELALNSRSTVYKGALDRYPSLQASSPLALCPLCPLWSLSLSLYLCTGNITGQPFLSP